MRTVTQLKWASTDQTALLVQAGDTYIVPWPSGTWHGEFIQRAIDGGMPILPPDPPPPPTDQTDIDNLERAVKALGLVTATWAGKTPAQLKAAFRTAWGALAP